MVCMQLNLSHGMAFHESRADCQLKAEEQAK